MLLLVGSSWRPGGTAAVVCGQQLGLLLGGVTRQRGCCLKEDCGRLVLLLAAILLLPDCELGYIVQQLLCGPCILLHQAACRHEGGYGLAC